jgi:hypothetical protein
MKGKALLRRVAGLVVALTALFAVAVVPATSSDPPKLPPLEFGMAVLNAVPEPLFDPLADPPGFFNVKATEYDPAHTNLVQGAWLDAIGCPTEANVATYPSTTVTGTFTDSACTTGTRRINATWVSCSRKRGPQRTTPRPSPSSIGSRASRSPN